MEYSFGVVPLFKKDDNTTLVCIVRHAAGHWAFPKGHPEDYETPVQAALRELKEETGITDIALEESRTLEEHYTFIRGDISIEKTVTYFIGYTSSTVPDVIRTHIEEIQEVRWVELDEAESLLTYTLSKQTLKKAVQFK